MKFKRNKRSKESFQCHNRNSSQLTALDKYSWFNVTLRFPNFGDEQWPALVGCANLFYLADIRMSLSQVPHVLVYGAQAMILVPCHARIDLNVI